jgi:hypothetical protein
MTPFSFPDGDPTTGEERKFENPDGCKAIVAVAEDGDYVMIVKPDLWFFFEESNPKDNGFPQSFDMPPGVYEMTFSYKEYRDSEGGVDDGVFTMETANPLWTPCPE